jgi:hypothetical protein
MEKAGKYDTYPEAIAFPSRNKIEKTVIKRNEMPYALFGISFYQDKKKKRIKDICF